MQWGGEVGLADLEVDDVASRPLQLLRTGEDAERGLGAEASETLGETRSPNRSHSARLA